MFLQQASYTPSFGGLGVRLRDRLPQVASAVGTGLPDGKMQTRCTSAALVSHRIRSALGSELVKELSLGANPFSNDIGAELHGAIEASVERMNHRLNTNLQLDEIRRRVDSEKEALTEALGTEDWKKHFRGRDILQEFAGKYVPGMRYVYFRELIISQMSSAGYQPPGMKAILDQIVAD